VAFGGGHHNAGDIEATVEELFAPRAARRVKRLFTEFYSAFPDWREEIVESVAEGDTVAGRLECSGTHRGEFLGEPPTGKRMEVEEAFFLRVEDGKIVEFWALEDGLGRMRQLGLLPSRSSRSASSEPTPSRQSASRLRRSSFLLLRDRVKT
jgi:predicted ester cyclase